MPPSLLRRPPAALLLLLALSASPARADTAAVDAAVGLYEYGDYDGAARGLSAALATGLEGRERTRARTYLASTWQAQGDAPRARKVVEQLLAEDRTARIDPALFPPRFLELFESVRAALPAPAPLPVDPPKPADPLPAKDVPRLPQLAFPPPPLVILPPRPEPAPLALAFVPFGVGQFANDSPKKGAFFLAAETLAFGAFAVALTAFESKKLPGSPGPFSCTDAAPCQFSPADASAASRLQTTYLVSLYTGLAMAAVGIVDAVIENRAIAEKP